ncbi:MAG: C39 family peptidase [Prevotella sp.]|nr:C39 family peptidase [Prevotella sp.]
MGTVIGDPVPFPGATPIEIQQAEMDTCAVKSQQIVMHAFGLDIPESQLAEEAAEKGYYAPGFGSDPEQVGRLLNDHGIPTHVEHGATVYDLINELAQGHKVIVGVDAEELWRPSPMNDIFGEQANHALIVTGIDTTDPNNIEVVITDPGSGDVAKRYPIEQFLDAWHDSSCLYVATDEPAPKEFSPEMVNFDYDAGHLPSILSVPYEFFTDTILPIVHDVYDWVSDVLTDNFIVNGISDISDFIGDTINDFLGSEHVELNALDFQTAIEDAKIHIDTVIDDYTDGYNQGQDLNFHDMLFS